MRFRHDNLRLLIVFNVNCRKKETYYFSIISSCESLTEWYFLNKFFINFREVY